MYSLSPSHIYTQQAIKKREKHAARLAANDSKSTANSDGSGGMEDAFAAAGAATAAARKGKKGNDAMD